MIYEDMYHGSDYYKKIIKFKPGKRGNLGPGIYFTSRKQIAEYYACKSGPEHGKVYKAHITVNHPFVVTTDKPHIEILGKREAAVREDDDLVIVNWIQESDIKKLKQEGYDAIVWKFGNTTEISVLQSENIKIIEIIKTAG